MRATLMLDDDLLAEAQRLTGLSEKSAVVRAALHALIQRESGGRIAPLSEPEPATFPSFPAFPGSHTATKLRGRRRQPAPVIPRPAAVADRDVLG